MLSGQRGRRPAHHHLCTHASVYGPVYLLIYFGHDLPATWDLFGPTTHDLAVLQPLGGCPLVAIPTAPRFHWQARGIQALSGLSMIFTGRAGN